MLLSNHSYLLQITPKNQNHSKHPQEAISSRLSDPDDGMEIVVVSDTVRQRRSRTPLTSVQTENMIKDSKSNMPDLLPKTFHLAESSSLFSQINSPQSLLSGTEDDDESNEAKFSVVEIRETNISPPKRVVNTFNANEFAQAQSTGEVFNTCSILESVNYLEPCSVETVHIIDATSEPSDTDTSCSTPNLDDRPDSKVSSDDESDEYVVNDSPIKVMSGRCSFDENKGNLYKDRDLLKDSENWETKVPAKPHRKRLTPTLKEILSADRDSFYSADNEIFDEPLTFSDDDNNLDGPSTERDTVLMNNPHKQTKILKYSLYC